MGILSRFIRNEALTPALIPPAQVGPRFAVDVDTGVLYGVPSLDDLIYGRGAISRDEALRVPAVKRARDLIAGAIGQFPLTVVGPDGRVTTAFSPTIIGSPEAGVSSTVSMSRLVEDLLFFGKGWWKTRYLGWHGKPVEVVRLDPATVTVRPTYKSFPEGTALVWPDVPGLIRFDSPNDGLLDASPAIKAAVALDRASLNAVANGTPPVDYFTPSDGVDPADDEEITDLLDAWATARKTRSTAYVPAGLSYNTAGWDPEKLQLAAAREFAITEVARLTGIDAEDLSVSTTSRTYQNAQDRKRARIEDVLGPYMAAIEDRLSMNDVTPVGYTAKFDTSSFLRLDDAAAATTDATLINAGVLTPNEARAKRGLDPVEGGDQPRPPATPALPAPEETANA